MRNNSKYLLEKIASMYYVENMNQNEIAENFGISRSNVSRLLKKAREEKVVDIRINYIIQKEENNFLEITLKKRFGLLEVIIVDSLPSHQETKEIVAEAAAEYFDIRVSPDDIIGVTAGTTLELMARKVSVKKKNLSVVSLAGSVDHRYVPFLSQEIQRRIINNVGGHSYMINAPIVMSSKTLVDKIFVESGVRETTKMFNKIRRAFLGIGVINLQHPFLGMFSDREFTFIQNEAVGNIGTLFFNIKGEIVCSNITEKTVGIRKDELMDIPNRIGIASGKNKAEAILGSIRSKLINILITEYDIGEILLDSKSS